MIQISNQSPEIMLNRLIKRLLELRGASDAYLEVKDADLYDPLTEILKKLKVAEILHDNYVVAIAGEQGSGKTTFLKEIYDLDDTWLSGNQGQGERSPLLVLEDETLTKPQGVLSKLTISESGCAIIEESNVNPDVFRDSLRNLVDGQLIPKLYVPSGYFEGGKRGFLLLPGYEPLNKVNKSWQELMRQALIGSAMCVIVTDKTRMANSQQLEVLRDMEQQHLSGAKPLIIISKTENETDCSELEELRQTAAEVFRIPAEELMGRVICSGTGSDYRRAWLPSFEKGLSAFSGIGDIARSRQLDDLRKILHEELLEVIRNIVEATREKNIRDSDSKDLALVTKTFETFDKSAKKLRKQYSESLENTLNSYAKDAVERGKSAYKNEEMGYKNHGKRLLRWFKLGSEEDVRMKRIEHAWHNGDGFSPNYSDMLGHITSDGLSFAKPDKASYPLNARKLLGYLDDKNEPVKAAVLSEEVLSDLQVLFYPKREGESKPLTKEALSTVELIPVLGLEFTRIASIFPDSVGVDVKTLIPHAEGMAGAAARIEKDFGFLMGTHSNIIKGIAAILAVDIAVDGKIDTIPALVGSLTGSQAGAAASVATVVAGGVAIGILSVSVLNEIHRVDTEQRDMISRVIYAIRDTHREHYLNFFDNIMARLRHTLEKCLTVRYRLDEDFMRRDRLNKALADVRSLRSDMLEVIGESASSLV